ncbi:ribosome-associated translation inhibitor RaiA [Candidatus Woesebacteria bacterium]|nr:ribosome-associated translation inhibitor RaiA [Candidatus Woesebacteria bacterium]
MQVIVEGKNLSITEALRQHATHQAEKLLKIGHNITKVRVYLETVAKKNNDPKANSVTFHVEISGADVTIEKHAVDMYQAIVDAAESAVRTVRKAAEKKITKARLAVE